MDVDACFDGAEATEVGPALKWIQGASCKGAQGIACSKTPHSKSIALLHRTPAAVGGGRPPGLRGRLPTAKCELLPCREQAHRTNKETQTMLSQHNEACTCGANPCPPKRGNKFKQKELSDGPNSTGTSEPALKPAPQPAPHLSGTGPKAWQD